MGKQNSPRRNIYFLHAHKQLTLEKLSIKVRILKIPVQIGTILLCVALPLSYKNLAPSANFFTKPFIQNELRTNPILEQKSFDITHEFLSTAMNDNKPSLEWKEKTQKLISMNEFLLETNVDQLYSLSFRSETVLCIDGKRY